MSTLKNKIFLKLIRKNTRLYGIRGIKQDVEKFFYKRVKTPLMKCSRQEQSITLNKTAFTHQYSKASQQNCLITNNILRNIAESQQRIITPPSFYIYFENRPSGIFL